MTCKTQISSILRSFLAVIFFPMFQGNLNQAHLENLDKAVVGLRKTEVDNVDGDDLANALENMKDTMSEVMTEMDDTTLAAMVEKVQTQFM